jgi:hypothetical protein
MKWSTPYPCKIRICKLDWRDIGVHHGVFNTRAFFYNLVKKIYTWRNVVVKRDEHDFTLVNFNSLIPISNQFCHNSNLGLVTKARACKSAGQEKILGVWESVRMNIHTPKWTSILGVGLPVDCRNFKERLQWPKPLTLKSYLYHWKAIEI